MNKGLKTGLIATGIVFGAGMVFLGGRAAYRAVKRRKTMDTIKDHTDKLEDSHGKGGGVGSGNGRSGGSNNVAVGRNVYVGSSGKINIRETPKVDDGYIDNKIGSIEGKGKLIGKVILETMSDQTPPEKWYKVRLDKPMKEWMSKYEIAYVHAGSVKLG